jgi:BASS family bile acid:Na+ symporter
LTYLSKGDVSLSISLTAVVSLITPFTIPIVAALSMSYFMGSASEFNVPILKTILQLALCDL